MKYIIICLAIMTGWSALADANDAAPIHHIKITTTTSITQHVDVIEHALGRIEDPTSSTIRSETPARIRQVMVDVGQRVHKGDTLAQLDTTDMRLAVSAAKAKVSSLRAQAKNQQAVVKRYASLAQDKFISTTMLEQAQTQATALKKALQVSQSQLKQAQHHTRQTRIVAPYDGIVQQRMVASGDYVGVGKPMFKLVGQSTLNVVISLPETRSRHLHQGTPVRLHLPQDNHIIDATIRDISPAIIASSNALEARIQLAPQQGWYAGGTVIADIIVASHPQAVLVPEESVVLRPQGDVVYAVHGDHVQAVPVSIGIHQNNKVEIIHGLKAGEVIAHIGAAFLSDGALITVKQP
ncbi:MAG: efflux RND transporter periplasmic adaptor subunit [Mariprofundaceae bacterium]|nr:efflux RND transporter periplasmic adaptor subunit [Mariprofundaceae bacterium]